MYIDCFDSVKTQVSIHGDEGAQNNAIFSEAFLFNLLLSGYIPNFTPSQFIDSSSIFNITSSNKDIFIDIINAGFITINLFHDELVLFRLLILHEEAGDDEERCGNAHTGVCHVEGRPVVAIRECRCRQPGEGKIEEVNHITIDKVGKEYFEKIGYHADFYVVDIGKGAGKLD